MSKKQNSSDDKWLDILLGVLAILLLKSIFENNDSKIVSKEGQNTLSDSKKMDEVEKRLKEAESEPSQNKEVII